MAARLSRIIYLCYDGLCDQIGQSQVLPYLSGCAGRGHRITAITFEKPAAYSRLGDAVRASCTNVGIDWRPQQFHDKPPLLAKAWDLHRMRAAARQAMAQGTYDLVHGRSYQGSYVALELKRRFGIPMLFDMRGFWADQRREGGRWRDGSLIGRTLYRQWKVREAEMLREADHIVTLTGAARDEIMSWPDPGLAPISVIPCCADFDLFHAASSDERAAAKRDLGIAPEAPVLGYLGSTGTVYRFDAHLRLFDMIVRDRPDAAILVIGNVDHAAVIAQAAEQGLAIKPERLIVRHAARSEVPDLLAAVDVATGFCTEGMSSKGVSLTKLGEYLACGVPMIGNDAVGDTAAILHELGAGLSLPDLSDSSLAHAAARFSDLQQTDRQTLRERARTMFDLPLAVKGYSLMYDALTPLRLPDEG
jgi:glycosyltransferase involved in cell wall biosynthesis